MSPSNGSDQENWSPTREFLQHIETNAAVLRQRAKVGPSERLDPFALADEFNIKIEYARDVPELSSEDRARLEKMGVKIWSGMGGELPDGTLLIMLNPNQTIERANVTVMEEVAHAYYGHKSSQLNSVTGRDYDEEQEREAYWTAAAALLPSREVAYAVYRGQSAKSLAEKFGASEELAEMRIKTLSLWPHYKNHSTK